MFIKRLADDMFYGDFLFYFFTLLRDVEVMYVYM